MSFGITFTLSRTQSACRATVGEASIISADTAQICLLIPVFIRWVSAILLLLISAPAVSSSKLNVNWPSTRESYERCIIQ